MPKMTIPSPTLMHFRFGRASISKTLYPDLDQFFDDLGETYARCREGVLRRRLPLSAVRRHHLGVPLLREGARAVAPARRQSGRAAGEVRQDDQSGAGRKARRHDDHDAHLPRQFPLHLDFARAATSRSPKRCSASSTTTASSSNTTPSAPAASSRCASCRRATSRSCSGSSHPRSARWRSKDDIKRRIDEATKYVRARAALRSRRNAALPPPRKATC